MDTASSDLWLKILTAYSRWSESEDVNKLNFENELSELVEKYLNLTPHNFKFSFQETYTIFKHNILYNQENIQLNSFKFCNAWLALTKYANNLLSQPWRKEFNCIKLYSGFYKHQIEPILLNAKEFLKLMGYKETNEHSMVLNEPIAPEKVQEVALDAFMATVEYKILCEIFNEVSKYSNLCLLKDVIQCREMHCGNKQNMISHLVQKYQHRYFPSVIESTCSFTQSPILCNGTSVPIMQMPYPSTHLSKYPIENTLPYQPSNGYYNQHPHSVPIPTSVQYNCTVPLGDNLIDHEQTCYRNTSDSYSKSLTSSDEHYQDKNNHLAQDWNYVYNKLNDVKSRSEEENLNAVNVKSNGRDYGGKRSRDEQGISTNRSSTSRRHGNQGNSNRKLDELDNVDSRRYDDYGNSGSKRHDEHKNVSNRKFEACSHSSNRRPNKSEHSNHKKYDKNRKDDNIDTRSNSSRTPFGNSQGKNDIMKNNQKDQNKSFETDIDPIHRDLTKSETVKNVRASLSPDMTYETDSLQNLYIQLPDNIETANSSIAPTASSLCVNLTPEINDNHWNCKHCTYSNKNESKICQMCAKSRFCSEDSQPLESGGKLCENCTLVNEKESTICKACHESLQKSPTYV